MAIEILKVTTARQANELLIQNGIKIKHGQAYNIYACGCTISYEDDPSLVLYFPQLVQKARSCPIHQPTRLIMKYKMCFCGTEYCSTRLRPSQKCVVCSGRVGEVRFLQAIRCDDVNRPKFFKTYKGGDPERWNCVHWKRCEGWAISEDLEYRPCLECPDYILKHGNYDALAKVYAEPVAA